MVADIEGGKEAEGVWEYGVGRIFGPRRDEVTGEWRRLHNDEINELYASPVNGTATYRCDDTRGCIVQFWPPDDKHVCSKHVEAWNKLIIKFSASIWLILR